jgi:hypothetical protein
VYAYLFSQPALNLTPIEAADNNDNYVAWLQLQPPNKQQASAWLEQQDQLAAAVNSSNSTESAASAIPPEQQLPPPPRMALAMLIQGRRDPPRVAQVGWCTPVWCACGVPLPQWPLWHAVALCGSN